MTRYAHALALLFVAVGGCGALGGTGGGANDLPVSGSGPFRPLDPADPTWSNLNAPFVLIDSNADLDTPFVIADGDRLSVWVTATRNKATDIERADAPKLESGFGDPSLAIGADQQWEKGSVDTPSLIVGDDGTWVMFYGAAGAIGFATSSDGQRWTKSIGPTLTANGREEGSVLSSPAAVRIDDRVRVYYLAQNSVWAAETSYADVAAMRTPVWTRLDGDAASAKREPFIARPAWAAGIGGVSARVAETPAGRLRHDVYLTVLNATYMKITATSGCGFASSYTGQDFATGTQPIVPLSNPTRAPSETPYRAGALLLFVQAFGAYQAIAAGTSP